MKHDRVPKHKILKPEEKKKILEKYNIELHLFPKIRKRDPVIKDMKPKIGDLVEITRKSPTAGETKYYRVVVLE